MNRINFYITLYIIIKVYVGMNDVLHRLVSKLSHVLILHVICWDVLMSRYLQCNMILYIYQGRPVNNLHIVSCKIKECLFDNYFLNRSKCRKPSLEPWFSWYLCHLF